MIVILLPIVSFCNAFFMRLYSLFTPPKWYSGKCVLLRHKKCRQTMIISHKSIGYTPQKRETAGKRRYFWQFRPQIEKQLPKMESCSSIIVCPLTELDGAEGNRTPVRKPIHQSISHYSHYFHIPSNQRLMTGCGLQ